MKNNKIFILTEGSGKVGFGHVMRCLSLYQAFEAKGFFPSFVINGDDKVRGAVKGCNCMMLDWIKEQKKLFAILDEADLVVIDSYMADLPLYKKIKEKVKSAIYLDDNKRISYPEGVVVNGTIGAEKFKYKKGINKAFLLGSKYLPLRKEFWSVPKKRTKEKIGTIMVTFGGDDPRNMSWKVVSSLTKNFPGVKKLIVVGRGFQKKNVELIKENMDKRTKLFSYPNANKMKDIMLQADVAISAGGQTLYELARIGLPAIAVTVADNQKNNVKGWKRAGFISSVGWWQKKKTDENILQELNALSPAKNREKIALVGRRHVDGKGAVRIAKFAIEMIKKANKRAPKPTNL